MRQANRIGEVFGLLTVIGKAVVAKPRSYWTCKCECGNSAVVANSNLSSGNSTSCGCLRDKSLKKEMVGKRFGRLVVIREVEPRKYNGLSVRRLQYLCKCDCGEEVSVVGENLRRGDTSSCGCALVESGEKNGGKNYIDLCGQRFSKLLVVERAKNRAGQAFFRCLCDCGKEIFSSGWCLRGGITRSCGCARSENNKTREEKNLSARKINARRHARKKMAYSPFDKELFQLVESEVYELAVIRTSMTGILHEVDHIVPLTSAVVCGLHNEHNLRVLSASMNRSKGNRYWPDMPGSAPCSK